MRFSVPSHIAVTDPCPRANRALKGSIGLIGVGDAHVLLIRIRARVVLSAAFAANFVLIGEMCLTEMPFHG